jgi:hypothetical protein
MLGFEGDQFGGDLAGTRPFLGSQWDQGSTMLKFLASDGENEISSSSSS